MSKNLKVFVSRPDIRVRMMFDARDGFDITQTASQADIMVFTGGADVSPRLYNEEVLRETFSDENSDRVDLRNLTFANERKMRKIGICRGAQFLNVMSGGALWQDVDNHACGKHMAIDLGINEGSKLEVTSTHHQMMIPSDSGVELCISNLSKSFKSAKNRKVPKHDTEVVFYENNKTLCFQPHPEYGHRETLLYFFDLIDTYIL